MRKTKGHPILPAEDYSYIYDKFGADAADETLDDVQEGKISVKTLEKYLYNDDKDDEDDE